MKITILVQDKEMFAINKWLMENGYQMESKSSSSTFRDKSQKGVNFEFGSVGEWMPHA